MDNPDDAPTVVPRQWAAPVPAVVLGLLGAVGLLAWVALGASTGALDAPGRLLLGVAGVVVGAAALVGLRARPRLAADEDALVLRGALGTRRWPWARVDAVRVVRMRRLGLPAAYLEIDARDDDGGERLLVLGRLELGTDPGDVAEALQAHRADVGRLRPRPPGSGAPAADGGGVAHDGPEGHVAQQDRDDEDGEDAPGDDEARGRA
ncbi:MAG: hypothetical protein QOE59_1932 [Actinomycetota bacterium]|nr:hypothetical protein [Actinomycetota bacterium]